MKNIKRFLACIMALCLCLGTVTMNAFAAEQSVSNENSTRAVQHNQVWIDAGRMDADTFLVTNPHPFGGSGFGRLRLESNDPNVEMYVMVTNGGTSTYCSYKLIRVGSSNGENDITFEYNSLSSELVVHYWVKTRSNNHGMRLNCWLS